MCPSEGESSSWDHLGNKVGGANLPGQLLQGPQGLGPQLLCSLQPFPSLHLTLSLPVLALTETVNSSADCSSALSREPAVPPGWPQLSLCPNHLPPVGSAKIPHFSHRVRLAGMKISRPPTSVGHYKMVKHRGDKGNEENPHRWAGGLLGRGTRPSVLCSSQKTPTGPSILAVPSWVLVSIL